MFRNLAAAAVWLALTIEPAGGFPPHLVRDIHEGSGGSTALPLAQVGGLAFLSLDDQLHGPELWVTDGSAAGTVLVKDIRPGGEGSFIGEVAVLGGLLFFTADDGEAGQELWRSDGTEAGTFMVTDLFPGGVGSEPHELTVLGGQLYFAGNDGTTGIELWRTDGTAGGTLLVIDLAPSFGSSSPGDLTDLGGSLVFAASSDSYGRELWRTDGTVASTTLISDIAPGTQSSDPKDLTTLGSEVFFSAFSELIGRELWKSNGTEAGTVPVRDIDPGSGWSYPEHLRVVDQTLMFFVRLYSSYSYEIELWRSDGTEAGTTFVAPIERYCDDILSTAVAGDLFFFTRGDGSGLELWRSDGTFGGTFRLETFLVSDSCPLRVGDMEWLTTVGQSLYFAAADDVAGRELWTSDGSISGTRVVADIRPGALGSAISALGVFGGDLLFQANDGFHGLELWRSDGTEAGTVMVADVVTSSASSHPFHFGLKDEAVYFAATDGLRGYELWTSDGTAAGTRLVKERIPGPGPEVILFFGYAYPLSGFLFAQAGDLLFYVVDEELWRTDGTEAGAWELALPPHNSGPRELAGLGDQLFFELNRDLWVSDGTDAGTELFHDSYGGVSELTVSGSLLFFQSSVYPASDWSLWRTDGSPEGTTAVLDSYINHLTAWNGSVLYFFQSFSYPYGHQLWLSDGTPGGNSLLGALPTGIEEIVADGPRAFIALRNGDLWKTDGTAAGTVLVRSLQETRDLTPAGGFVYFSAIDPVFGRELWRTDGSLTGTQMVVDVYAGPEGSDPDELTELGGELYFAADSEFEGRELWRTDGTAAGTIQVDLRPGPSGSDPRQLTASNGVLFLNADDGIWGRELWRVTTPPTITVGNANVEEGTAVPSFMRFPVRLSHVSNQEVRLSFTTLGSSASAGTDYHSTTGTVVIPVGSLEGVIEVEVIPDSYIEEDELFLVLLSSPINASLGTQYAEGSIFNDDHAPGSCGLADVLDLADRTIYDSRNYQACKGIRATEFQVDPGASVLLEAGVYISLGEGFRVVTGGEFEARLDSALTAGAGPTRRRKQARGGKRP